MQANKSKRNGPKCARPPKRHYLLIHYMAHLKAIRTLAQPQDPFTDGSWHISEGLNICFKCSAVDLCILPLVNDRIPFLKGNTTFIAEIHQRASNFPRLLLAAEMSPQSVIQIHGDITLYEM